MATQGLFLFVRSLGQEQEQLEGAPYNSRGSKSFSRMVALVRESDLGLNVGLSTPGRHYSRLKYMRMGSPLRKADSPRQEVSQSGFLFIKRKQTFGSQQGPTGVSGSN